MRKLFGTRPSSDLGDRDAPSHREAQNTARRRRRRVDAANQSTTAAATRHQSTMSWFMVSQSSTTPAADARLTAAKIEMEMMTDLFNKMSSVCQRKCIGFREGGGSPSGRNGLY